MKPGARPRAYDPSIDSAILLGVGSAHAVDEAEGSPPAGRLFVPDAPRGSWREYYVAQRADSSVAKRPIGFRIGR